MIRFLRFDCTRARQVVPAPSDAALQQALADVSRISGHDELVLEVDEAEADTARRWLADCMRQAGGQYLRRVPVVVGAGTGLTWADTKGTATPVQEVDEWAA